MNRKMTDALLCMLDSQDLLDRTETMRERWAAGRTPEEAATDVLLQEVPTITKERAAAFATAYGRVAETFDGVMQSDLDADVERERGLKAALEPLDPQEQVGVLRALLRADGRSEAAVPVPSDADADVDAEDEAALMLERVLASSPARDAVMGVEASVLARLGEAGQEGSEAYRAAVGELDRAASVDTREERLFDVASCHIDVLHGEADGIFGQDDAGDLDAETLAVVTCAVRETQKVNAQVLHGELSAEEAAERLERIGDAVERCLIVAMIAALGAGTLLLSSLMFAGEPLATGFFAAVFFAGLLETDGVFDEILDLADSGSEAVCGLVRRVDAWRQRRAECRASGAVGVAEADMLVETEEAAEAEGIAFFGTSQYA